jgi:DNA-binding CsgD family transcriptional regulator
MVLRMANKADQLAKTIALISRAPFVSDGWSTALLSASRVAGGWGAQMVAQSNTELRFNLVVNLPDEAVRGYVPSGAVDPLNSPRLYAGIHGPMMRVISDGDYLTPEMRREWRIYEEYYDVYDAGYACSGRLENVNGLSVVVGSLRSKRAGDFELEERMAFQSLLPHIRAAFDVQTQVGEQAINLTVSALEAASLAALVCDPTGKLLACSPSGEVLLSTGEFLSLRRGYVRAAVAECDVALSEGLTLAGSEIPSELPTNSSIILRDRQRTKFRRLEISPLPRDLAFSIGPAVLVVARNASAIPKPSDLAQFGLSVAEAHVAYATALGRLPSQIAVERSVSRETVRSQLKAIYSKLGVHNAAQLAAKLSDHHF